MRFNRPSLAALIAGLILPFFILGLQHYLFYLPIFTRVNPMIMFFTQGLIFYLTVSIATWVSATFKKQDLDSTPLIIAATFFATAWAYRFITETDVIRFISMSLPLPEFLIPLKVMLVSFLAINLAKRRISSIMLILIIIVISLLPVLHWRLTGSIL